MPKRQIGTRGGILVLVDTKPEEGEPQWVLALANSAATAASASASTAVGLNGPAPIGANATTEDGIMAEPLAPFEVGRSCFLTLCLHLYFSLLCRIRLAMMCRWTSEYLLVHRLWWCINNGYHLSARQSSQGALDFRYTQLINLTHDREEFIGYMKTENTAVQYVLTAEGY
jgi:hypothetical protein